jgi:hypothetical protein
MTTGPSCCVRISLNTGPTVSWSTTRCHIADIRAPGGSNTLPAMAGLVCTPLTIASARSLDTPAFFANTGGRWERLVDQQIDTVTRVHQWVARSGVAREHDTASGVVEAVTHRSIEDVDHRERRDRDPVALMNGGRPVIGDLGREDASTGLPWMSAHRLEVPRVRGFDVPRIRTCAEGLVFAGRAPHLDGVASTTLGEAPQQGRHVTDVIGVQVADEHLRRRGHRQAQTVEVRQRPRAQVEEEQVVLLVANLDEHRRRRLALLHERITAAQYRHPDLVGRQLLGSRNEDARVCHARCPDHRRGRQRLPASFVRQLGQLVDLHGHTCLSDVARSKETTVWTSETGTLDRFDVRRRTNRSGDRTRQTVQIEPNGATRNENERACN